MQISIIVPIYNVREYLPSCVDSLLANDTRDCEIILVDDGATDGCGVLCDQYAREHPELIRVVHQDNGGLGAARNTGIEAAAGEWLLCVDSDDKIHPGTLAALKSAATPDLDVVGFQFFADNGVDPPTPQTAYPAPGAAFTLEQRKDYLLAPPSAWMRMWRKALFLDNGIRYPSKVWYEDIRTTVKLEAAARRILILPDSFYYYLSRPGSIMNNSKLDRNREIFLAMDDILEWFRKTGRFERYREELCALTVQHVLLAASVRVARQDPKHPLLAEFRAYTDKAFPDWKQNSYNSKLPRMKRLALWLVDRRQYRLIRTLFNLKG